MEALTETGTKDAKQPSGMASLVSALKQAIEKLVLERKDIERRLIDLKAQTSVYEDEIRNAINSGMRFMQGSGAAAEISLEEVDGFVKQLSQSTHEMGNFVDAIARRRAMLDKNKEFEIVLEEVRQSLTNSINDLERLASFTLDMNVSTDDERVTPKMGGTVETASLGSSAIIRSQEMERQRLAREIHDGPAQAIANVVLRLDIVKKVYDKNPESVPKELGKMKELAQNSLNEIRGFIFDLRPMTLQDLGLAATIKRVINSMASENGPEIQLIIEGEERPLDPNLMLAIFRIAQESINNMSKHSEAGNCWVHLKYFDNKVILIVEDDGKGFDDSQVAVAQKSRMSFGLLGIRERADDICASLDIKSEPGEGTKMTLVVVTPVRHNKQAEPE